MEKLHQLYDGQAKRVYATDNPNAGILSFKDEATAYGGLTRSHIDGKGAVNNRVSYHLMEILEQHGIPTHLISLFSDHETLVKKVRLLQVPGVIGKYKNGRYRELPGLIRHLQTDTVTVHADYEIPVNLDGEARFAKDVTMKLAKEKVRFFYPRGLQWKV